MPSGSTTIARSRLFTLEDGSWVIQRGIDRVQELLSGKERSFSSMDITFEITDPELGILQARGIVEQFDDFFVWVTSDLVDTVDSTTPGLINYYYVQSNLGRDQVGFVQTQLEAIGLSDRYAAAKRFERVVIMRLNEEPFTRLSHAEDAQILLAPVLQGAELSVEVVCFQTANIPPAWLAAEPTTDDYAPLIRRLEPKAKVKTVVCIDGAETSHHLIRQICSELGADIASAHNGQDGITLIQDADPTLIIMDLTLPDIHGYEVVAFVRTNPELAHIPIIVVTALASETDWVFARTVANVEDYVVKPLHTQDMRRRIWRVLNRYSL
ncbi:MAG: response regulator [Anaerolineales bacterium]|nr:response regulator [Anaerolineales bacterium]